VKSLAFWMNYRLGISEVVAREKVRVARVLRDFPLIDAAFEKGEVSYSKVRTMKRVATSGNESHLMMIARHGTASHMEQLVRGFRKHQRIARQETSSVAECRWFQEDDGMYVFHLRLPAEDGALVVKAMESIVEMMRQSDRADDVSAETLFSETSRPAVSNAGDPATPATPATKETATETATWWRLTA